MIFPNAISWADRRLGTQDATGARVHRGWLLACIASLAGVLPLVVVRETPLQDWPSHLARIQILSDMMAGPSPWSRFYEVRSFLLPNVVLDAVVLALLKLGLGVDLAGKVFLLVLYAVFLGGFLRLASAFGAGGPLKLMLGVLLFYNGPLFYGLVNYEFGLGLAMLFTGSWVRSGLAGRVALATLGTLLVFESHLVAAFVYVALLGSLDLHALWQSRGRSLWHSASALALAVTVALLMMSPTGHDGFTAVWDNDTGPAALMIGKAGLFAKALLGGSLLSDAVFAVGGALAAALGALTCRAWLPWPAVLAVVVTGTLAVVAPGHLGAGSLLDYRIALVPWLVLAAGVAVWPRTAWHRRCVLAVVFALVLARGLALTWSWRAADAEFANLESTMEQLPRDSALLVGRGRLARDVPWGEFWAFPYNTIATYAVRFGVVVPSVYAHPAQQPLVLKAEYRAFNDFNDVSTPHLVAVLQGGAAVHALCRDFPGGVSMLVLFPTTQGLPGMARVGTRFGLLNMCVERVATAG